MRRFTDLYKSPDGHYFVEPRFELFVCGDFVEKIAFDKPHFVRLPHDRVEAVEGEGLSAVDRCFGLVVAHTRRLIHHKSFFGDFCANDLELSSRHPSARTARTRPRADGRVPGESGRGTIPRYMSLLSLAQKSPKLRVWSPVGPFSVAGRPRTGGGQQ